MSKLLRVMNELLEIQRQRKEEAESEELATDEIVSLVYSFKESLLDLSDCSLREGQFLATDLYYRTPVDLWGATDATAQGWPGHVPELRSAERITEDRDDYGVVYGAAGERIGVVHSLSGSYLYTLQLFADGFVGGASDAPRTRRIHAMPVRGLPGDPPEYTSFRDVEFERERIAAIERTFGPEWRSEVPALSG